MRLARLSLWIPHGSVSERSRSLLRATVVIPPSERKRSLNFVGRPAPPGTSRHDPATCGSVSGGVSVSVRRGVRAPAVRVRGVHADARCADASRRACGADGSGAHRPSLPMDALCAAAPDRERATVDDSPRTYRRRGPGLPGRARPVPRRPAVFRLPLPVPCLAENRSAVSPLPCSPFVRSTENSR